MQTNGKVSIIIPAYRTEKTIARCLQSCVSQTLPDIEVLVILNGPEDNTQNICRQFADPRIRVLQNKDAGVSAARNKGMDEAFGEYLTFLDADDELEPDACRALWSFAEKFDLEIASEGGNKEFWSGSSERCVTGEAAFSCMSLIHAWGKLYRTAFLSEIGLRFDETMDYGEDQVFVRSAAAAAERAGTLAEHCYRYRQGRRTLSQQYHADMKRCLEECLEAQQRLIAAHPAAEEAMMPGKVQLIMMQVFNLYGAGAPFHHSERVKELERIAGEADTDVLSSYLPEAHALERIILRAVLQKGNMQVLDNALFLWKKGGMPLRDDIRRLFNGNR